MGESFRIHTLLWTSIVLLLLLIFIVFKGALDSRDVVFVVCDVGNGDALYFRSSQGIDVVIDFGSGSDVLECLGRHMGFMDKTIELAFVTHMHYDHYGGLRDVLESYSIETFVEPSGSMPTSSYTKTLQKVKESGARTLDIRDLVDHQTVIRLSNKESIRCVWPSSEGISYMTSRVRYDQNTYSQICVYMYGRTKVVLTGDATPWALSKNSTHQLLQHAHILKVPHHGSREGLTEEFLSFVYPQEVVVSVGKENAYGHPSKSVVDMITKMHIPARYTSIDGEVRYDISSDGTFLVHTHSR